MTVLRFEVEGSQGDAYDINVEEVDRGIILMTCNCKAALEDRMCHHRLDLLYGEVDALISENASDLIVLREMIRGSLIETALTKIAEAQALTDNAKTKAAEAARTLYAAKSSLRRLLKGQSGDW